MAVMLHSTLLPMQMQLSDILHYLCQLEHTILIMLSHTDIFQVSADYPVSFWGANKNPNGLRTFHGGQISLHTESG